MNRCFAQSSSSSYNSSTFSSPIKLEQLKKYLIEDLKLFTDDEAFIAITDDDLKEISLETTKYMCKGWF